MSRKLFVANFPFSTTNDELAEHFGSQGEVVEVNIINDRETGRSRGFGFVEMVSEEEAENAVQNLNGSDLAGRPLTVRIAEDRQRQGGGRGGQRGHGGPRGPRY